MSTFEEVSAKIGRVTGPTKAVAQEIYEAAKAAGHEIWYIWGYGTSVEHATGRALDLMVRNEAAGDWVRDYVWNNRIRLRLQHVIWEQHITSTTVQPGVRRKMEDRGNDTANHYDHGHVLLYPGAYQPPVNTPSVPTVPVTDQLLVVDGRLGPKTIAKWQKVMGTTVDGKIDPKNSELVFAVQRRLKYTVDQYLVVDGEGIYQNGNRYKTIYALQRYLQISPDGVLDVPVSQTIKHLQVRLNQNRF